MNPNDRSPSLLRRFTEATGLVLATAPDLSSQEAADEEAREKRRVEGEMKLLARTMRRTCLFSHLDEADLRAVSNAMDRVPFKAGDRLGAAEGDPTQALYVITRGKVERRRGFGLRSRVVDETLHGMGDLPDPEKAEKAESDKGSPSLGVETASWSSKVFGLGQVSPPVEQVIEQRVVPSDGLEDMGNSSSPSSRGAGGGVGVEQVELVGESQDLVAFGTLHALDEAASFATTVAVSDGLAFKLGSPQLRDIFDNGSVARGVARGLSAEIFRMSDRYRTPLFEQPPQVVNVAAVSVAAAFEAYYRAAMNSLMNASLTGQASALFPNMHLQIPTRVAYINGFKATRQWLSNEVDARLGSATTSAERAGLLLVPALLPGVLMTPVSGLLEACNAGESNPEPLFRRMWRGLAPRCVREVVFGVGLNQLSDYFEERVPSEFATSKVLRNALGSVTAGLVSGYLSHVPHNLSTMKLLDPKTSYGGHFNVLVKKAEAGLPVGIPSSGQLLSLPTRTPLFSRAPMLRPPRPPPKGCHAV